MPKFKTGSKVKISARASPFNDHVGVIDQEPVEGNFRFWYMVKFMSNGYPTIARFAEEQLHEVFEMNPTANQKVSEINVSHDTRSGTIKQLEHDIPMRYHTSMPKFKTGSKVKISARASPFNDHVGVIDQEPVEGNLRFWYMVKFMSNGYPTVARFAEEQIYGINE